MFIERLYTKLGAPPESSIAIRVSHGGFKGRTLTSASQNRSIRARMSSESESTSEIVTVLGDMQENRVEDVRRVLEPMFMLFDYMQFNVEVYDDIIRRFERGEVS